MNQLSGSDPPGLLVGDGVLVQDTACEQLVLAYKSTSHLPIWFCARVNVSKFDFQPRITFVNRRICAALVGGISHLNLKPVMPKLVSCGKRMSWLLNGIV